MLIMGKGHAGKREILESPSRLHAVVVGIGNFAVA